MCQIWFMYLKYLYIDFQAKARICIKSVNSHFTIDLTQSFSIYIAQYIQSSLTTFLRWLKCITLQGSGSYITIMSLSLLFNGLYSTVREKQTESYNSSSIMQNTLGNQSSFLTRKNIFPSPQQAFLRAFWNIWLALHNFTVNKRNITSKHLLRAYIDEEYVAYSNFTLKHL